MRRSTDTQTLSLLAEIERRYAEEHPVPQAPPELLVVPPAPPPEPPAPHVKPPSNFRTRVAMRQRELAAGVRPIWLQDEVPHG